MEDHAGGDARAAVGDHLAVGQRRERLLPGRVARRRDTAGLDIDRVRLAAEARCDPRVDEYDAGHRRAVKRSRRPTAVSPSALVRDEHGRLHLLHAAAQRAAPRLDAADEDGAVVVAEVAEEPPQSLGAGRAVCNHVRVAVDAGATGCRREDRRLRQRMPAFPARCRSELRLDVDECRSGDVGRGVRAATSVRVEEVPAAVDEAVAHVLDATPREGLHADVTNAHPGDVGPSTSTGRNAP